MPQPKRSAIHDAYEFSGLRRHHILVSSPLIDYGKGSDTDLYRELYGLDYKKVLELHGMHKSLKPLITRKPLVRRSSQAKP